MANEYLKRTNTSVANKKVFTYSFWMKGNDITASSQARPIYNYDGGSGLFQFFIERSTNTNPGYWVLYGSGSVNIRWEGTRIDPAAWYHIVLSINTTRTQSEDRAILYVNGVRTNVLGSQSGNPGTPGFPALNAEQYLGANYINGISGNSRYQLSDFYYVDGQALTADVFGFYKDGKGYQSSGTTKATDFRPGQWSPHSPRKIKTEIERRGGFGVNGFYLPMNDSSNPGADFHCTPNSIIKLKGEDLPQPRNGAPTTSDAYVSQLREDPYAANLVLAVPGVELENTNPELVTNGDFSNGTTGWTGLSGGSLSVEDGKLKITETTGAVDAYACNSTAITTVVGRRYTIKWTFHEGTNTTFTIRFGNSGNQSQEYQSNTGSNGYGSYPDPGTYSFTFTATATTLNLSFIVNQASSYGYVSNVSVKEAVAVKDYSADIKGSGTNKTVTEVGLAGVYPVPSYYGSAMRIGGSSDYFDAGSSSDFDFGSGDFTVEYWQNVNSFASTPGLGIWDNVNNQRSWLIYQNSSGRPRFYVSTDGTSSVSVNSSIVMPTNQWIHFCMERNGSNLVGYVNGVCVGVNRNLGTQSILTPADPFLIGKWETSYYINGEIQDLRVYKGVAKYKGGFDVPKPYTPVGIESWRQVSDTCNGNNFATMNPLASTATHTNGGLTVQPSNSVNYSASISNLMVNSGKWYCELRFDEESTGNIIPGISELENLGFRDIYGGSTGANFFGQSIDSNDTAGVRFGVTANDGDIISMYMDLDSSPITCSFTVNGGSATTYNSNDLSYNYNNLIPGRTYGFVASDAQSAVTGIKFTFNFGQNPSFSGQTTAGTYTDANGKGLFKYQPPAGYLALCTDNLPTPAIADPGDHFKSVLWTGDGRSYRSVTGVGFAPDFVWIKVRNAVNSHYLFDTVRGADKALFSDLRDNENDYNGSGDGRMPSFDSDGFTVSHSASTGTNESNDDYVAWCWKAGGPAVSNNDGSIAAQISANQDSGFSIVSYTGNGVSGTVGHGLGKTPNIVICKNRSDDLTNWSVNGNVAGLVYGTNKLMLQVTGGIVADTNEVTGANATTITLGNSSATNDTNDAQIAYCWTEIEGFSKFGSYTGIGGSNGTFINCGFKPAFLMIKRTDAAGEWWMYDSSRGPTNPIPRMLMANSTSVEQEDSASYLLDFVSNGFKWRSGLDAAQGDGNTYLYMAFAESPLQTANAK